MHQFREFSLSVRHCQFRPGSEEYAEVAGKIAQCYQRVFGMDQSWNEGSLCKICSRPGFPVKFNFQENRTYCDNGHALTKFWPINDILSYLKNEISRPDAVLVVCWNETQVVGGALAYTIESHELETRLDFPGFSAILSKKYPEIQRFVYLSELFVDPHFQQRGIGKELLHKRLKILLHSTNTNICLFRTKRGHETNASVTYKWYTGHYGFEVIAEYRDTDDRVILAQTTSTIHHLVKKE